jgi:cysteine synthase
MASSSPGPPRLQAWTLAGIIGGASLATVALSVGLLRLLKLQLVPRSLTPPQTNALARAQSGGGGCGGFMEAIGDTKMIELKSLSRITGCRVLGKCEFLNPGGSSKDRIAKAILLDAIRAGRLRPVNPDDRDGGDDDLSAAVSSLVVEGTSGSTGISLALAARSLGLQCMVIVPDDIAKDKTDLLTRFGAQVRCVPAASDSSPEHYVNRARSEAAAMNPPAFFADQFEHPANHACHYDGTGAEVWAQTDGVVDAFISGSGTGGTIAGVGRYLRERRPDVRICLADPQARASLLINRWLLALAGGVLVLVLALVLVAGRWC